MKRHRLPRRRPVPSSRSEVAVGLSPTDCGVDASTRCPQEKGGRTAGWPEPPSQPERQRWSEENTVAERAEVVQATLANRPLAFNKNFVLLWVGQFVSQIGDRLAMVAFPWLVYQSTDSAFSTGVMLALYALPYVLFGAFAGVIIDRFNKRSVMVTADLIRAALTLSVPLIAKQWPGGVYLLSFTISSVAVFFDPCKLAILPDLVAARKLLRANSLLATGETLTETIGFALAGLVVYAYGTSTAFMVDAATFVVSAVALLVLRYGMSQSTAGRRSARGLAHEAREGIAYLFGHRGLAANTLLVMAAALGAGATYPLTFLYAAKVLGGGMRWFGFMESSIALGYLVGAIGMAALGERASKGLAMTAGVAGMGAAFAVVGVVDTLALTLVPFFIVGVTNAVALISIDTYCQEIVPEPLRGRVWGTRFTLTQGIFAISVLIGAALAVRIDVATLFIVCGTIVAVSGVAGIFVESIRRA